MTEEKKSEENAPSGKKGEMEELKDKIMHPKATTILMKRVPKKSVDAFKKYANDEFVGDYGMAFKKLVDTMLIEPQPYVQIYTILEDHENRLAKIEGKPEEQKFKVKKTISGREIKIPIRR